MITIDRLFEIQEQEYQIQENNTRIQENRKDILQLISKVLHVYTDKKNKDK